MSSICCQRRGDRLLAIALDVLRARQAVPLPGVLPSAEHYKGTMEVPGRYCWRK